VAEARAAVAGGAAVVDIKEPDRGPLGCADFAVWRAVRSCVPEGIPISVALGELGDWSGRHGPNPLDFAGIAFRKLGLAGSGRNWRRDWDALRAAWGSGPSWVAVAYADWQRASAPHPDEVLEAAVSASDCSGVLVDTWDKTRASELDASWHPWLLRARQAGRTVALAGGLDAVKIARLASLGPDLFAVRGAACTGGNRNGSIDFERVARLVETAAGAQRARACD
jgi:uncharacterized protein (UPF0264 family)